MAQNRRFKRFRGILVLREGGKASRRNPTIEGIEDNEVI